MKKFLFFFVLMLSYSKGRADTIIHVFVALCDNESQGIVPVPKAIGDGNNPQTNLYWGAGYGVKTFFKKDTDWKFVYSITNNSGDLMERLVFKHKSSGAVMVADAYRGNKIKKCIQKFVDAMAGHDKEILNFIGKDSVHYSINLNNTSVVSYIGHDGLMEFEVEEKKAADDKKRNAIILACYSKSYFMPYVKAANANPLVWTTHLMGPEAYTLEAALESWLRKEDAQTTRRKTAEAYHKYLKCGMKGAMNLFVTGF